jgi:hypothetical protein
MVDQNKILVFERNGSELADGEELLLSASAIPSTTSGLVADNVNSALQEIYNALLAKVFGNSFQYAESLGTSTNTSASTYVTKLTFVTSSLPAGNYILSWTFVWSASNANRDMDVRIRDSSTTLVEWVGSVGRVNAVEIISSFKILPSISGVKTYTLEFKCNGSTTTLSLRDAIMTLWRVS